MDIQLKNAFVLGAGLGTRMRPLSSVWAKPIMPVFGKPIITFALDHLRSIGIESFVINTHHLSQQFENRFCLGEYAGCPVKLVHEPVLLETGGGIKNAQRWIGDEPFIVYSGDILTDIDVGALVDEHFRMKNDVTLALRKTGLASGVAVREGRVVDIGGKLGHAGEYDFANVSVWNPEIYSRIEPGVKISFVPVLVEWIKQGGHIGGLALDGNEWFNIGSRTEYLAVHRFIAEKSWRPAYGAPQEWPVKIDPHAWIAPTAKISGASAIGPGSIVGEEARLKNCILWDRAVIASGASLRDCIVTAGGRAEGEHTGADF